MMMEKAPFAWWHFWAHMRVSSLEGIEYRNSWNSGSRWWWWWWYTVDAHHQGRFLYEAHSKVQLSVCLVRFLVVCVCSWVSLSLSLSCFFLARLVFLEKANGLSARRVLRVVEPQHGEREKKNRRSGRERVGGRRFKVPTLLLDVPLSSPYRNIQYEYDGGLCKDTEKISDKQDKQQNQQKRKEKLYCVHNAV